MIVSGAAVTPLLAVTTRMMPTALGGDDTTEESRKRQGVKPMSLSRSDAADQPMDLYTLFCFYIGLLYMYISIDLLCRYI